MQVHGCCFVNQTTGRPPWQPLWYGRCCIWNLSISIFSTFSFSRYRRNTHENLLLNRVLINKGSNEMLTKLCVMFFAVPSCLIRDTSFKTFNQNNRPYSRYPWFLHALEDWWDKGNVTWQVSGDTKKIKFANRRNRGRVCLFSQNETKI